MKTILISIVLAAFYYAHAPLYLRVRHHSPKLAVFMARAEAVAEFAFLVLVVRVVLLSL